MNKFLSFDKDFDETDSSAIPLKDQVKSLHHIIISLNEELELKNKALAHISKEKDRASSDLKKYKRSNTNLRQQLEDERAFYLKEKEFYCREMIENKKVRKKQSEEFKQIEDVRDVGHVNEMIIEKLKTDLSKTKAVMNETLQANYNLSIKFLRMKNTKYSLKARLKQEETENAKLISNSSTILEKIKEEIDLITSNQFRQPIAPSNKKYLQVIKQNTQLMYENLHLQIEISKLYNNIEKIKADKIKHETHLKLKYTQNYHVKTNRNIDKIYEDYRMKNNGNATQPRKTKSSYAYKNESAMKMSKKFAQTPKNIKTQSLPELKNKKTNEIFIFK